MMYYELRVRGGCNSGGWLVAWGWWVTRRKPHTPGTAKEHQRQKTPTVADECQSVQLADQAWGV